MSPLMAMRAADLAAIRCPRPSSEVGDFSWGLQASPGENPRVGGGDEKAG